MPQMLIKQQLLNLTLVLCSGRRNTRYKNPQREINFQGAVHCLDAMPKITIVRRKTFELRCWALFHDQVGGHIRPKQPIFHIILFVTTTHEILPSRDEVLR